MASGQERVLRRRIRGIESTKKLTRAMELISASQIVRAQTRIADDTPYAEGLDEVLRVVLSDATEQTRLVGVPDEPRHVGVIAIVSDRGLCGAYNLSVLRTTERMLEDDGAKRRELALVTVGRKAQSYFRFRGREIDHAFSRMTERPSFADARRVAAPVTEAFLHGELDLVRIVSTRFVSAGVQRVEARQLLPLSPPERAEAAESEQRSGGFYEFEPRSDELVRDLVGQYAEAAVFRALLEAAASEHTARQRAMAAATDNADELAKTLRRVMNRVRQEAITTEIMEIVGGAEALRTAGERAGSERLAFEREEV